MDQRGFQRLLRRTVALPVVLLVMLAITLAGEIVLLSATLRWVDHSDQVISTARQVQRQIVEMDTGLRGYYLTGDQTFLDSYNDAKARVPDQFAYLQNLTGDNTSQQERLAVLSQLYSGWMQWADQQVQSAHKTPPSAADLLSGQELMQAIRQKQRVFVAEEEGLRRQRSARAKILNATVVGSAVGLSLLIAVLLFFITRRELLALSSTYERHLQAEAEQREQLKESRKWFQIALKSLGEGVVATDREGLVSFINPVAQKLTGWEYHEATGRHFREVVHLLDERTRLDIEDPTEGIRKAQQVVSYSASLVLTSRDGKEYPLELTGAPILGDSNNVVGLVFVFRDTTQRRQTEQTLRTSERLTLAGRLSATIAHEIRNPLDTVTNLVYLLQHEEKSNPDATQYLNMASEELTRIAQITSQLLTFHRESRSPVPVNLNEVLESVLVLFSPQIRQNHIQVSRRFETNCSVRGYPGELRQVFSNLVGNAIEAIAGDGGQLVLHTRESSLSSDPNRKGIRITVLDSGSGIPRGVRKNLFAPFYTTKGEKGTGLGLWISRSIVEKHEGTIHVTSTSRNGRSGTAFSVFLPYDQTLGLLDARTAPPV
ncbi:MAG TPA: CHASE3 domain-containing protein [Verrucomicrobiae bacterium]|jgi:PAS domain S-box-containing protein|nr:CHASE3 domain-containing protein [Verrucomicrobiae bacterium]